MISTLMMMIDDGNDDSRKSCERRGFSLHFFVFSRFWSCELLLLSLILNEIFDIVLWSMWSCKVFQCCCIYLCLFLVYQGALGAVLRNVFCIICSFFIFVCDVVAHTGYAYVISGLIIEVYNISEYLVCSLELLFIKGYKIFIRV